MTRGQRAVRDPAIPACCPVVAIKMPYLGRWPLPPVLVSATRSQKSIPKPRVSSARLGTTAYKLGDSAAVGRRTIGGSGVCGASSTGASLWIAVAGRDGEDIRELLSTLVVRIAHHLRPAKMNQRAVTMATTRSGRDRFTPDAGQSDDCRSAEKWNDAA